MTRLIARRTRLVLETPLLIGKRPLIGCRALGFASP